MTNFIDYQNKQEEAYLAKKEWLSGVLEQEMEECLGKMDARKISDEEYESKILPYWSKYGIKPSKSWFEYYGSRDGVTDPRFIPDGLYYCGIVPYLNNLQFSAAVKDKSYLDITLPDALQAATVCRRISGEFFDKDMNLIDIGKAADLCMDNASVLFVKPALYTSKGHGIKVIKRDGRTNETVLKAFEEVGDNFIVQEAIKQHPDLASLSPNAVNTIRVVTLFVEGKVHVIGSTIRIADRSQDLISLEAGGYDTPIAPDGTLGPKVQSGHGKWLSAKEAGLYEESFKIPSFDRICKEAQRLHPRLAHFKLIGWDFSVNTDGDPVLIEINFVPGIMSQLTSCRPYFGDMTDWVLDDFFIHRTLENNQIQGLIVQY